MGISRNVSIVAIAAIFLCLLVCSRSEACWRCTDRNRHREQVVQTCAAGQVKAACINGVWHYPDATHPAEGCVLQKWVDDGYTCGRVYGSTYCPPQRRGCPLYICMICDHGMLRPILPGETPDCKLPWWFIGTKCGHPPEPEPK
jgi:hypothetical protein